MFSDAGGIMGECRGVGALLDTTLGASEADEDRDRSVGGGRWCIDMVVISVEGRLLVVPAL